MWLLGGGFGGRRRQQAPGPAVLALLALLVLPWFQPASGAVWTVWTVDGEDNSTAWTLTREKTVEVVLNYTCYSQYTTGGTLYFTDRTGYLSWPYYTSLSYMYCYAGGGSGQTTVTMDVSAALYNIYGSNDGTYYFHIEEWYSYTSDYTAVTVTRPYTDYIAVTWPAASTITVTDGDTINIGIKYSVNKHTYGYYSDYVAFCYDATVDYGTSTSTVTTYFGTNYVYAFYGTYNLTVSVYYGMTGYIFDDGTYPFYALAYYESSSLYTDKINVDITFDNVKSLTMPSKECTYGKTQDCTFKDVWKWTASTTGTAVNVYFVNSGASATPTYSNGQVSISGATISPYMEGIGPGTYSFPVAKGSSPGLLADTSYTIWLVVVDSSGKYAGLRTKSVTFAVACAFPYYGTTCSEAQNLTNSFAVGFFSAVATLVVLLFAFMGDWVGRWADRARKAITERAVTVCRNMVTAFNALAAADAKAAEEAKEALKKQLGGEEEDTAADASRSTAGLLVAKGGGGGGARGGGGGGGGAVAAVALGAGVAVGAGATAMAAQSHPGAVSDVRAGLREVEDDGTAVLKGAVKNAVGQSTKVVTDKLQAAAKTRLTAIANTAMATPSKPPAPAFDPVAILKTKVLPVIKEVVMSAAIYAFAICSQYMMDFLQILANGLLMIKSFASSFNMNLGVVFPTISVNIKFILPPWLHWFPAAFSTVLAWFQSIFANISFGQLAMKNMQAPGEVLNNLVLIIILFLLYEVYFLEAIRVTFRGFARVSTQFIKRKSVLMGRVAAFTLPGAAVAMESGVKYVLQFVFALLVVSAFFEYKGSHARTAVCDSYRNGMDSVLARLGAALFWVTVLPIIHVALKALIPGMPAGELSASILAVRNRTLHKVLNPDTPADHQEEEEDVEAAAAAGGVGGKKTDSKKKKQDAAAKGKKKRGGGCFARCGWAIFDFIFGLNRTEGLHSQPKSIAALQSPRGPASPTASKVSAFCCVRGSGGGRGGGGLASAPPETPVSPGSTRPLTPPPDQHIFPDGHKWPKCMQLTWPGVRGGLARLLRLSLVLGCMAFFLSRFLFVIMETSEISQAIALNQTCHTMEPFSSLVTATPSPTPAPTTASTSSSSFFYTPSPTAAPTASPTTSTSTTYTQSWDCNFYTEYYSKDYREPCIAWSACILKDAQTTYTTQHAAMFSAALAVPLALLWLLFRCFSDWHKRQCRQEIVFRDVQRLMPSCVLKTFGYVSRSEKKLQKRLAKLAELDRMATTSSTTPRRSGRFSGVWSSPRQSHAMSLETPTNQQAATSGFSLGAVPRSGRRSPTPSAAPNPTSLLTLPDKVASTLPASPTNSPPLSPSAAGHRSLRSPHTSKGLRKLRGALPRAWPSVYAVFEMIKSPGKEGVVWEDLVAAKKTLDDMRRTGDGPIPITDEYLKRSFVYQLMKRCEEDAVYEATIKQIFTIVATFTDDEIARGQAPATPTSPSPARRNSPVPGGLSPQAGIALAGDDDDDNDKGGSDDKKKRAPPGKQVSGKAPASSPAAADGGGGGSGKVAELKAQVKAVAGDLLTVASAALSARKLAEDEEPSMDYSEFRHFVSILVPPREVPSYLELVIAMLLDVRDAFKKWWVDDKHRVTRLWAVPFYWFDGTMKLYIVVMYWKIVQLMKLTFGFWDRELIEAFRIRDRADEFDEDPDDDRECDLDILAATGQTRVLFWQIMPYTVVLSKLGEAFNYSPPYIEDAAMTEKVSFKKDIDENGQLVYEGEPVLRAIKPFAPGSLAWLFPFEYNRAVETGTGGLTGIRLQAFITSTSKFFTTLLLVAFPQTIWLQLYFFLTVPFRLVESVAVVESLNIVDTDLLSETFGPLMNAISGFLTPKEDDGGDAGGDDDGGNDNGGGDDDDDDDDDGGDGVGGIEVDQADEDDGGDDDDGGNDDQGDGDDGKDGDDGPSVKGGKGKSTTRISDLLGMGDEGDATAGGGGGGGVADIDAGGDDAAGDDDDNGGGETKGQEEGPGLMKQLRQMAGAKAAGGEEGGSIADVEGADAPGDEEEVGGGGEGSKRRGSALLLDGEADGEQQGGQGHHQASFMDQLRAAAGGPVLGDVGDKAGGGSVADIDGAEAPAMEAGEEGGQGGGGKAGGAMVMDAVLKQQDGGGDDGVGAPPPSDVENDATRGAAMAVAATTAGGAVGGGLLLQRAAVLAAGPGAPPPSSSAQAEEDDGEEGKKKRQQQKQQEGEEKA